MDQSAITPIPRQLDLSFDRRVKQSVLRQFVAIITIKLTASSSVEITASQTLAAHAKNMPPHPSWQNTRQASRPQSATAPSGQLVIKATPDCETLRTGHLEKSQYRWGSQSTFRPIKNPAHCSSHFNPFLMRQTRRLLTLVTNPEKRTPIQRRAINGYKEQGETGKAVISLGESQDCNAV